MSDLAGRRDTEWLQQQVAHTVEEIDDGLGEQVKGTHRGGKQQHHRPCASDGRALRSEFTYDDMKHRDDGEGECSRQSDSRRTRALAQQVLEEVMEGPLADDAESERSNRDAKLARGEVRVDMNNRVADRTRAGPPLRDPV